MHQKLSSKYFGPYRVLQRVGPIAYKIELPAGAKIHPVFHVSLLKQFIGDCPSVGLELPLVSDDGVIQLEPETIIGSRWVKNGGKFVGESLVKWKRLPREEATW